VAGSERKLALLAVAEEVVQAIGDISGASAEEMQRSWPRQDVVPPSRTVGRIVTAPNPRSIQDDMADQLHAGIAFDVGHLLHTDFLFG
jgi:hypothetical protein